MARTKTSGSQIASVPVNRQNDTTNTTVPNARIETGWGYMDFAGAGVMAMKGVTFQTPFTDRPIVVVTHGGDFTNQSTTAYGTGGNIVHGTVFAKAVAIKTTGFDAYAGQSGSTNYPAGSRLWFQWIAIGV